MSESTVLVTGGAGYIGSHTCKALAAAGYLPVTYDNLSRGHRQAVKWGPLVEGDILDKSALTEAFKRYQPDAVLHFAAFAYVGESVTEPIMYYRNNFTGALNLVDVMREQQCHRLVFSSTCATYGMAAGNLITEDDVQAPINAYGRSKWMVEHLLRDCDSAYGLHSVALRYFNAAGADEAGELIEDHDPETHIIPLALQTAAGQRDAFDIYGTDYSTPDGTAVRDYIHVADLAAAHVLALRYLQAAGVTTALNLGTGQGYSVQQVIDAARKVTGRTIATRAVARRPGDPPFLVADARRARAALGWQPVHTSIETMVATAWTSFPHR